MINLDELINKYSEEDYKNFSMSLIPNTKNIIGVRIPKLRKIAKEIYKKYGTEILSSSTNTHEGILLKAMIIGLSKNILLIQEFIPFITNWAVCDIFCADLKITKNKKKDVFKIVKKYAKSKKEFELRFALVMLLNYFIEEDYLTEIFKILNEFKSNKYYAQMAAAWLISVCCVKYPNETMDFLKTTNIDDFTFKKSIQKINESYRVDKKIKTACKQIKR